MAYLVGTPRKVAPSQQRRAVVQRCNSTAQSTDLIENRTVVLMAALDPEVLVWRPLLQGMGLTVFNGFHQEGMGDCPVILVSDALWRQADWPRQARFIRQQFPTGILCVLRASVVRGAADVVRVSGHWDDARTMLGVAGIDFFTLEDLENASDT